MSGWWAALALEEQVYWAIALVATALVVIQTLLMFLGDVSDLVDAGDADLDGPGEHPSGIHLLSSRTIVAFFVGFGWTGVIATDGAGGSGLVPVAATIVGLLFAAVILYLMRFLHSLRHSGTLDYANALGEVATVYLPIPAAMAGSGRIQVMIQGRLKVVQALTHHRARLENRTRVRVVELLDESTLVVEPLPDTGANPED
jgi:hypothetical protein